MFEIINIKSCNKDINNKRTEISKLLMLKSANIKGTSITKISVEDLNIMFRLYDQVFFNNWFKDSFRGNIKFSLSKRMTKSAGITLCPKNIAKMDQSQLEIEIRIGVDFILHYDIIEGGKSVGGIRTNNSVEALQLVLEHELCHVIEFIFFSKSSCSGSRFKTLANNLFGHTDSYHRLPSYRQIAHKKMGLNIGDAVSFKFDGKCYCGILYNIYKRAIVMVKDKNGLFMDNKGSRYSKFYVPLKNLE